MSLVISDEIVRASGLSESDLLFEIVVLRTYAANFLNAVYSVEIPPTPLDKGGGDSRGDLQRH